MREGYYEYASWKHKCRLTSLSPRNGDWSTKTPERCKPTSVHVSVRVSVKRLTYSGPMRTARHALHQVFFMLCIARLWLRPGSKLAIWDHGYKRISYLWALLPSNEITHSLTHPLTNQQPWAARMTKSHDPCPAQQSSTDKIWTIQRLLVSVPRYLQCIGEMQPTGDVLSEYKRFEVKWQEIAKVNSIPSLNAMSISNIPTLNERRASGTL